MPHPGPHFVLPLPLPSAGAARATSHGWRTRAALDGSDIAATPHTESRRATRAPASKAVARPISRGHTSEALAAPIAPPHSRLYSRSKSRGRRAPTAARRARRERRTPFHGWRNSARAFRLGLRTSGEHRPVDTSPRTTCSSTGGRASVRSVGHRNALKRGWQGGSCRCAMRAGAARRRRRARPRMCHACCARSAWPRTAGQASTHSFSASPRRRRAGRRARVDRVARRLAVLLGPAPRLVRAEEERVAAGTVTHTVRGEELLHSDRRTEEQRAAVNPPNPAVREPREPLQHRQFGERHREVGLERAACRCRSSARRRVRGSECTCSSARVAGRVERGDRVRRAFRRGLVDAGPQHRRRAPAPQNSAAPPAQRLARQSSAGSAPCRQTCRRRSSVLRLRALQRMVRRLHAGESRPRARQCEHASRRRPRKHVRRVEVARARGRGSSSRRPRHRLHRVELAERDSAWRRDRVCKTRAMSSSWWDGLRTALPHIVEGAASRNRHSELPARHLSNCTARRPRARANARAAAARGADVGARDETDEEDPAAVGARSAAAAILPAGGNALAPQATDWRQSAGSGRRRTRRRTVRRVPRHQGHGRLVPRLEGVPERIRTSITGLLIGRPRRRAPRGAAPPPARRRHLVRLRYSLRRARDDAALGRRAAAADVYRLAHRRRARLARRRARADPRRCRTILVVQDADPVPRLGASMDITRGFFQASPVDRLGSDILESMSQYRQLEMVYSPAATVRGARGEAEAVLNLHEALGPTTMAGLFVGAVIGTTTRTPTRRRSPRRRKIARRCQESLVPGVPVG